MNIKLGTSAGLLTLSAMLVLIGCSKHESGQESMDAEPVSVMVGTASRQTRDLISLNGQVESQETAIISTRVMGFISSIKVRPGDRVPKGALMLTINNGDILAKVAQAQATIHEIEGLANNARKDLERYEALFNQQSASAKELENATLHYNSIKSKLEAAQQLKNEAESMLAYTELVAPFSGVVTQCDVDPGSMANPGLPLVVMEMLGHYQVSAFASESEVGRLKLGMKADVVIKSTGAIVSGSISEISPSSQFSGGRFSMKITLADDAGLFSGMFAHVTVPLESNSEDEALFVPATSIVRRDQLAGLYIVNDSQTAQLRWLKLGKELGTEVEVLSGLQAGERFVTMSEGKLYNGVPVSVKYY